MDLQAPNLDCVSPEELLEYEGVFHLLANYCRLERMAMKERLLGNIDPALDYERVCQRIYLELPKEVRW